MTLSGHHSVLPEGVLNGEVLLYSYYTVNDSCDNTNPSGLIDLH
jgi:hypothetical protein